LIGNQLEKAGWRQGSVIKSSDVQCLAEIKGIPFEENLVLLIASQSCDIANNNVTTDPYIELSVAKKIDKLNGHYTHNKNPRTLHTYVTCRTVNDEVATEDNLELMAFEKIAIQKEQFIKLLPDKDKVLEDMQLKSYIAWLAARYSRPALPSKFNELIKAVDPKGKLRAKAKKGDEQLAGIYVEIFPNEEIKVGETYSVNILGLLSAGFSGDSSKAENAIKAHADMLGKAGMKVKSAIRNEDNVTVAQIKRFNRFYYDDLSIKGETPLPPEI
jgi:hypothetical protein